MREALRFVEEELPGYAIVRFLALAKFVILAFAHEVPSRTSFRVSHYHLSYAGCEDFLWELTLRSDVGRCGSDGASLWTLMIVSLLGQRVDAIFDGRQMKSLTVVRIFREERRTQVQRGEAT